MTFGFDSAAAARAEAVSGLKRNIKAFYGSVYREVRKSRKRPSSSASVSGKSAMRALFRPVLSVVKERLENGISEIEDMTAAGMGTAASAVLADNLLLLEKIGFPASAVVSGSDAAKKVIDYILSGKPYSSGKSFERAVTENIEDIIDELVGLIESAISKGMTVDEILSILDDYLNPDKNRPLEWGKLFPGTRKTIYGKTFTVATTAVSHTYEEMLVRVTKNNPFIEAYRWVTSGSDRVCPVCIERATKNGFGLGPGIFPKDRIPFDHPNGMCTIQPVITVTNERVDSIVAAWKNGTLKEPWKSRIDDFLKSL